MCIIEGCDAKPVIKGLCRKHYMRLRRHGDAEVVKETGPRADPMFAITRAQILPVASRFTQATYVKAWRMMIEVAEYTGLDRGEVMKTAVAKFTRANGSINVAALHRYAETELMRAKTPLWSAARCESMLK